LFGGEVVLFVAAQIKKEPITDVAINLCLAGAPVAEPDRQEVWHPSNHVQISAFYAKDFEH
jgi:hypothetical protein